jgi:hypothetical protein
MLSISWNSLAGVGCSLHLRVPRIIDLDDPIWACIESGDHVTLQNRLVLKRNTPTDVDAKGQSLFLVGGRNFCGSGDTAFANTGK